MLSQTQDRILVPWSPSPWMWRQPLPSANLDLLTCKMGMVINHNKKRADAYRAFPVCRALYIVALYHHSSPALSISQGTDAQKTDLQLVK